MNDIKCFINSLILASAEGRDPMTVEGAAQSLKEWRAEGWENIPEDLDAETLAALWNDGIKEDENEKPALKAGNKIKVHIMDVSHDREIKTRNYEKVFEVVNDHFGSPGIWWRGEENGLSLLVSFSWNVIFEDVETGELFHCDTFSGEVIPLDLKEYRQYIP